MRSTKQAPLASRSPDISVTVVRSLDELMQVMSMRSLVYMGEQYCPYDEEFDGNDLVAATHLLVRKGGEPIGAMRIRWFDGFAKFERICICRTHRDAKSIRVLMDYAFDLCARKGYRKILGHVQKKLLPLWSRTARFRAREGRPSFVFSDIEYIEVERDLEPPPDAISINSPAHVLIRPEGEWHRPGVLDHSAERGVAGATVALQRAEVGDEVR